MIANQINNGLIKVLTRPKRQVPYYFRQFLDRYKYYLTRKKIYVLGDSHTEIFEYLQNKIFQVRYYFDVTKVGGATAQGMRNPNSKTNALEIFKNRLSNIKDKRVPLIFQLGEVDTGFVIWYRSKKYGSSVKVEFKNSIRTYMKFLLWVKNSGFNKIIVLAAPLPTIMDNQNWGEVANQRKEVQVSLKERTKLTLKYNQLLKRLCRRHEIIFIDTDPCLLNPILGQIQSEFLNKNPLDHHLDKQKYGRLVFQELKKVSQ